MKFNAQCYLSRLPLQMLCLVCLLSFSAFRATQAQSLNSLERQRAGDMLKVVKDDIKKNYYDSSYRGMDVDARFKTADEKLKQATSLGQAFGIIAQAVLDLNDSHTFFIPPQRPVSVEYGWRMQMIGDKCYIIAVKPGSDAEAKGLKPGDLVMSIDNFQPNRKEFWKISYYYNVLSPRPGMQLAVRSPDGQERQLAIAAQVRQDKRVVDLLRDFNDLVREAEDADKENRHRYYDMGTVFVWKMPNFAFEPEMADSMMSKVKGHAALVLDLRGNPGGYVKTLEQLVGNFFDHDIKIADLKGRKDMKPMAAKTRGKDAFDGKVIVLVDSQSASCSEMFARLMQLEKRGIVIGDKSAGAVMQARVIPHELGTDSIVLYGANITDADVILSDGQSIEHIGVTPDEILVPTAQDMAAHRDPVLARALELAGIKVDPVKAGTLFPFEWKKRP